MPIQFNQIPVGIRVPGQYVEIDNTGAVRGLPGMPSKILVLGQMLSSGTATALTPVRVTDAQQAKGLFGSGSMLARQFAALKANNRWTESWAIPQLDDGAGVKAAGTLAFSGTVAQTGTLNLYIAGVRVRTKVAKSEANNATASAVAAAINAASGPGGNLPVTAAVNGVDDTQVDLTARQAGENGNAIDLRLNYYPGEATPLGLTVTIGAMATGAGNPDVSAAIAQMADEWWTDICMPWTDAANLTALEAELADRFGPMIAKDAQAYAAARGSHSALVTLGDSRNSPHLTVIAADSSPTPPEEWAAALTGSAAFYLHQDPARPLQTLPLLTVLPPAVEDRFTAEERNLLLYDGIATFQVDAGDRVLIERCITTYQVDAYDIADISYLDVQTLKTLAVIRYNIRQAIASQYPRAKIADDGTNGSGVATPSMIRGTLIARLRQLETAGIVEAVDGFKDGIIVERDGSDPTRVNALIPPDIVNPLRVFAGKVQFIL